MVIRQNRGSSYAVIVLPGQCSYTSPGTKSSRWRPKGRSGVVIAPDPRSATRRSTSRSGPFRAIPCGKGTVGNLAAMPTADLSAAADAVELAARVVEQGTQALADGGGPDVDQALGYDLAHPAAAVETARAMLDYGPKGDPEAANRMAERRGGETR